MNMGRPRSAATGSGASAPAVSNGSEGVVAHQATAEFLIVADLRETSARLGLLLNVGLDWLSWVGGVRDPLTWDTLSCGVCGDSAVRGESVVVRFCSPAGIDWATRAHVDEGGNACGRTIMLLAHEWSLGDDRRVVSMGYAG